MSRWCDCEECKENNAIAKRVKEHFEQEYRIRFSRKAKGDVLGRALDWSGIILEIIGKYNWLKFLEGEKRILNNKIKGGEKARVKVLAGMRKNGRPKAKSR